MPSRKGATPKPRQQQKPKKRPTPHKQPANLPAIARKIIEGLAPAEKRDPDHPDYGEFIGNLVQVMISLHRWKDDPDASTPSPYILQRNPSESEIKPTYVLTAAQLQHRIFAEAVNFLSPQDVPPLLQELAAKLGYRLQHREGADGEEGAFDFIPVVPEPAAHDIPAIAQKILIDLGAPEACEPDHPQHSEFWVNLLEVMRTIHAWRTDPHVLPPAPYVFRIEDSPKSKPGYAFSGAQLQQRIFTEAAKLLSPPEVPLLLHEIASDLGFRLIYREEIPHYGAFEFFPLKPPGDGDSAITPAPARVIEPPEPQKHEPDMAQDDNIIIKPDGTLIKGGVPYRAVAEAAPEAQAHRTTVLRWIRDDAKFEGRPLQSYYFGPAHTYFISEESIQRLANRFVKWPSLEPARAVTLRETKDKSGFIGMSEAADIAGVSRRTMWLWVSQGKAPTDKPLDVIQCPASDHFYIREKDAYDLKKLIPRSGLQRGRRPPQLVL